MQFEQSFLFGSPQEKEETKELPVYPYWQIAEIKNKVTSLAKKYNLKFEKNALEYFVNVFKEKQHLILKELEKISTYLMPETLVTNDTVHALYSGSYNIDELYSMILSGSFNTNAIDTLSTSTLYTLSALQNKLRQSSMLKVYAESKLNKDQISKLTGLHAYRVEKELLRIKNTSLDFLKKSINKLSEIEFKVKTGKIDSANALELFLVSLVGVH